MHLKSTGALCFSSMIYPNPEFSSAQATPGSGVFDTSFYLGIWVAKTLPKAAPPGLSFGKHCIAMVLCSGTTHPSLLSFFLKCNKIVMRYLGYDFFSRPYGSDKKNVCPYE